MDKSVNKRKIFIIVCICVVFISLIGGTLAYYVRNLVTTDEQNTITYGLDYYINYTKGQNIENVTLTPSWSYEESPSSDIEFWKKDDTYDIYGHIYLDINSMSDLLSQSNALKYVVINNDEVIADGVVKKTNGTMLLVGNIPLKTEKQLYTVHIWLDDTEDISSSAASELLSLSVRCEATMEEIGIVSGYITHLYLNNKDSVVINNGIEYQYAESVGLMNDRLGGTTEDYDVGNIRYYGANPNNYVDIGDRDSSGNVILYRIIGLFKNMEVVNDDGTTEIKDLIKVIRAESIGEYSWDNKTSGIGSSLTEYGSNDWSDARLMMMLNPGYEKYSESNPLLDEDGDIIYGYKGSLWWNSGSGTCYSSSKSSDTKTCDFTSTGLSSDVHDKIETVVWNLGGSSKINVYSNKMYTVERGTTVYSRNPTRWIGKVALMYPSDYGYATDFNSCTSTLTKYYSGACNTIDWLYNSAYQWVLTPEIYDGCVFYVAKSGSMDDVNYTPVSNDHGVRPVFYLKSELDIESGKGTIEEPYVIN